MREDQLSHFYCGNMLAKLKSRAQSVKQELTALSIVLRDARTPWYAKTLIALTLAYALSPMDLIPDFIPVLGYLDDILIVPFGITLALKLIPADVLSEARKKANSNERDSKIKE
jgi:uncharacterized membrane protein YkvA (DUF1232 family)